MGRSCRGAEGRWSRVVLCAVASAFAACGGSPSTTVELIDFGATGLEGAALTVRLSGAESSLDVEETRFADRDSHRATEAIRIPGRGPIRVTATLVAGPGDTLGQTGLSLPNGGRVAVALRRSGEEPFPCGSSVSTALVQLPADSLELATLYLCPLPSSASPPAK